ncbi:transglycosylase SLT domain-containing protein [Rhodoferax sp.]|uniref:transglycosylase SLT domain-containing protein n=1 Tax=Rhodoferax sp. TaxID=50421 RepID=UPI0025CF7375|nr:transglycosylase SLT domain-containing protein [Rhodoferax sp.]MCM2297691.1 transglycosylase SLT domain-containing protein [Rhodoferax sp.]
MRFNTIHQRPARRLAFLLCLISAPTGPALAQAITYAPPSAAVIEDAPPAVRKALQEASALESEPDSANTTHKLWQAAVLYCQASRWGSAEGQYRLGMLYAFGQGVPANPAFAASLFSVAAALGHAQAHQMLDTLEMKSATLPACVNQDQLPEKAPAPPPFWHGLPPDLHPGNGLSIEKYLLTLPSHKRWLIPLTTTMSAWYALDPKLVLSVIAVESNFDTGAQSPKAAMGLMQLIPDTAERFNVRNAYDATQNLRGGMRYLRWLLSYYRGNITYAAAAYNAGEGRVDRYKGVPPFPETRAYVKRVLGLYGSTRHAFDENLTGASPWLVAGGR